MVRRALILLLFGPVLLEAGSAQAGEVVFESKPSRTHLLELFTSEGCSSCPPAEAWLSNLIKEPQLWRDFVPVAFHVDYWDRLGWRDPFASKMWTARQYAYSSHWQNNTVYTPGFILDGREWRNRSLPSSASELAGVLKVAVVNGERVTASFQPATAGREYEIHLARLGFGLTTEVKAGENRGRKLLHDFVVLSLTNEAMNGGTKEFRFPDAAPRPAAESRSAIAAWVTAAGQLEPIQAVGGWLP